VLAAALVMAGGAEASSIVFTQARRRLAGELERPGAARDHEERHATQRLPFAGLLEFGRDHGRPWQA
jgi:hypothetical protein